MRDTRTLHRGQGLPYETRSEASPYYFKAPKLPKEQSRKSRKQTEDR